MQETRTTPERRHEERRKRILLAALHLIGKRKGEERRSGWDRRPRVAPLKG